MDDWLLRDEDRKANMLWDDWYDLGAALRGQGKSEEELQLEFANLYDVEDWWNTQPQHRKLAWEGFRAGYGAPKGG